VGASRVSLINLLKELYPTRDERELFAEILKGNVLVNGERILKPGVRVSSDAPITLRDKPPYVSRGGEKLAAALDAWKIDCAGVVWIDAGSSTGGFTDCLLQRGARMVYAVDVGEGQLDWGLREDPRVVVKEGTNVMGILPSDLTPVPERAVADLSFRSLRGAARHILGLTSAAWGIFLVKPQFEYIEPPPDFHGVVKSTSTLHSILEDLIRDLAAEGVAAEAALPSPIRGRKGNHEFLFRLRRARAEAYADPLSVLGNLVLE
jgi:23S rRNA (cytidine1920-2'-O)/16S rRNA (cytidine1409-2'-O)-methyltransferase